MLLPLWFKNVFPPFAAAPLTTKIALCVAIIAPTGLLMGFGFPTGMRLVGHSDQRPAPWFWGVNGAAGVLASIFAVCSNIAFGISVTLYIGAALYMMLLPTALRLLWPQTEPARSGA